METYSLHIKPDLCCDECGTPQADMVLVADSLEDGTGYQDVKPLCQECWERLEDEERMKP